jgi:hypothetical protein
MITTLSDPMTTLNAISDVIEYSRSLMTEIGELIQAEHIGKQVNLMIAEREASTMETHQKDRAGNPGFSRRSDS